MTYAQDERAALAALLDETGPAAPTLCAGWQTRDLAAHLVVREHRPDSAVGLAGGPLAGYTARLLRQYQERHPYPELVGLFRSGPPRLSPLAIPAADDAANTVEYFVHHEDVRRAGGDWPERPLDDGLPAVLWKRLKAARLFLRGAPAGLVLAREEGGKLDLIVAKGATRPDGASVTVTGSPAELTLWSLGRVRAARVTLDGPDETIAAVQKWRARGSG